MIYMPKSAKPVGYMPKSAVPVENAPEDTRTTMQKVGDFLGLGTTVRNIDTIASAPVIKKHTKEFEKYTSVANKKVSNLISQAKKENDPVKKQALLDQSRVISSDIENKTNLFNQNISKLQNISGVTEKDMGRSNAEFALRRGAGQTAELASYVAPSVVGVPTASVGQRVLQAAGKGAVAGGLQGAAGASTESENVLDAVGRIAGGTALGAATGAAIQGVLETPQMAREWWNTTAKKLGDKAKDIYATTLKQNIADQKFYKQAGGIDKVINEASAMKLPNTKNGMTKYLEQYGPEFERTVTQELNKSTNSGKTVNLDNAVTRAKEILKKKYGADQTILDSANNWFKSNAKIYSGETSLTGANKLRRGLDRTVGSQLAQDINQGASAAKKALATVIREDFKSQVPELKPAFRKYQLVSGLSNAMKVEPLQGLAEGASAATGAALGSLLGGPAAAAGAVASYFGSIAARSPGLKRTITSGVMNEARRAAPTVVRSAINASPVINPAISALQRAIDNENKSKQKTTKLP